MVITYILQDIETVAFVKLTIEFNNPEPNTLKEVAAAVLFFGDKAGLVGFVEVELQNEEERGSNNREDDRPSAIGPSPANVVVKLFRHFRSRKRRDDIRRRRESVS